MHTLKYKSGYFGGCEVLHRKENRGGKVAY